jgi:hypothetical protein
MFVGTSLVPTEISVGATIGNGVNGSPPFTYNVAIVAYFKLPF